MFCPYCGKQMDEDNEFCENCGAKLKDDAVTETSSQIDTDIKAKNDTPKKSAKMERKVFAIFLSLGIFILIAAIVIPIVISEVLDNRYQKEKDQKISEIQNSYFEFLPEMTIGDLLNHTHHPFNDSAEMWNCNIENTIEFWGYSDEADICMIINFTGTTEDDIAKISCRKIDLDKTSPAEEVDVETFESYILDLYISYQGGDNLTTTGTETSALTESTAVQTTTKQTSASEAKSDHGTYSITFEADELIEEAGLKLGGHAEIAVLSNLTCSNGDAIPFVDPIYVHDSLSYDSLISVEVTGAEAGEVVLSGTITTYGLNGNGIYYSVDAGVFSISKTVGKASEEKTIIELNTPVLKTNCYPSTIGDGNYVEITWDEIPNADGYYISYMVEYNGDAATITNKETKQSDNIWCEKSSDPIYVYNFSVKAYANINGKEVCSQWSDFAVISSNDYISQQVEENNLNMKGQINCHGGTVAGFTTEYVVNGGEVGKVRSSLGDTWHVTAKNTCVNYGVTWYELWDSDDGDYYGWVDGTFIDFY